MRDGKNAPVTYDRGKVAKKLREGQKGAQGNDPVIFATVAHDINGAHRQEYSNRLADQVVEVGLAQRFDKDRSRSQDSLFTSPRTGTPSPLFIPSRWFTLRVINR